MNFEIFLQQEAELQSDLAGVAHGSFQLSGSGIDIRFFEKRGCMVFVTLSTFLDDLLRNRAHKSATFRWVGEDNGKTFTLKKKDKLLEIKSTDITVSIHFDEFLDTVMTGAKYFHAYCLQQNPAIIKESAFIDFEQSIQQLDR